MQRNFWGGPFCDHRFLVYRSRISRKEDYPRFASWWTTRMWRKKDCGVVWSFLLQCKCTNVRLKSISFRGYNFEDSYVKTRRAQVSTKFFEAMPINRDAFFQKRSKTFLIDNWSFGKRLHRRMFFICNLAFVLEVFIVSEANVTLSSGALGPLYS